MVSALFPIYTYALPVGHSPFCSVQLEELPAEANPDQITGTVSNKFLYNNVEVLASSVAPEYITDAVASLTADSRSGSRPRGRPRKVATPSVDTVVRRSPRRFPNGYKLEALPGTTVRRAKSQVPKAAAPAVMQIEEM